MHGVCVHTHIHTKFSTIYNISTCTTAVVPGTGEVAQTGDLRRIIPVTLSIFNFSSWFFAQRVENRRGRLSTQFLGPGDNFPKIYDENQIWSERHGVRARARGIWCPARDSNPHETSRSRAARPYSLGLYYIGTLICIRNCTMSFICFFLPVWW